MSKEIAKQSAQELDGFDSSEGGIEGRDNESIIQGTRIKFGNAKQPTTWMTADGEPLPAGAKYVAVNLLRVVQKWPPEGDDSPPETRVLGADEKFPNTDELNAKVPKAEWRTGQNGELKGPFENAFILYVLDTATMGQFTYITPTVGGMRAVRDLRDRVQWMRKLKGDRVYAEVTLTDIHMPTRHGGRQRPAFNIERWVTFNGNGDVLAAPESPRLGPSPERKPEPLDPTRASARAALRNLRSVAEPSLSEELNDEIKY